MLSISQPLTRDEIEESLGNILFAKSLIGNVYTFGGTVESIKEDHAVITFYIMNENGAYATNTMTMVANLYLTFDELISIEEGQCLNFVGELTDASNSEESIPDWGKVEIVNMEFKNAAIVSDRFEATGKLHSRNASYGKDAWNIDIKNNEIIGE
jgi:hypothetical protein